MRFRPNFAFSRFVRRRSGYTLVEILVALTLTMVLMTAVVTVFGGVGDGIAKSRRAMEQFDRLRTVAQQCDQDLKGITVTLDGRPTRPEENRGYLELIAASILPTPQAYNGATNTTDFTVGAGTADASHVRSDILMFTTRNATRPFLGRYALSADPTNPTLQSDVAEVAWFLRGKNLHRRVLLVAPGVAQNPSFASLPKNTFFGSNDISARLVNGQIVPNSLGDLTKRENRFAHPVDQFPFDARRWGLLGLPTLYECSSPTWMGTWVNGTTPPVNSGPNFAKIDLWDSNNIAQAFFGMSGGTATPDQYLAQDGVRLADDVIMTNVIGFTVKVWEPAANNGTGGYVDLGYGRAAYNPQIYPVPPQGTQYKRFGHTGMPKSGLQVPANTNYPCVYDSYCFSYENEGIYTFNQSGNRVAVAPSNYPAGLGKWPAGTSTNGLDDDGNGLVDDSNELITQPPYAVPLRGIQIKIRCYEPDSKQIREITLEHDFLPK